MTDAQGKILTVGDTVKIQKWDETDKRNPTASLVEGKVAALRGGDWRDERAGEVVVVVGESKFTLATGAVNPPPQ